MAKLENLNILRTLEVATANFYKYFNYKVFLLTGPTETLSISSFAIPNCPYISKNIVNCHKS